MRLTSLHKLIITISFAVVIVGILVWLLLWAMDAVDDTRLEIVQINSRIAAREEQRKHALFFTRLVNRRPHDFERIVKYFVDPANPIVFIETLERLAKQTQNHIKLDVGSATVSEGELIFNVLAGGTKESVLKYLRLVELLPYELRVENFEFGSSGAQNQAGTNAAPRAEIQATLRVNTLLP